MTGWYDVENTISHEEITKINDISKNIRKKCDLFIVVGIGGSYLGSKMVISQCLTVYNKRT